MNLVSNGMLIVSAVCLTLALIHLRFGFTGRSRWAHLLFAASALSTAAYALTERSLLLVNTPEEYAAAVRLSGITAAMVVISTTWFVYFYLESRRLWLLWTITVLRVLALFLNVVIAPNGGFRSITDIRKMDILGEQIAVPVLTPSPLRLIGQSVLLLFVIFCMDAAIGAWRRGERERAAVVGGGAGVFGLFTFLMSILSLWGFVEWPITASPLFLAIIAATAYELNRDVFHATELARELTESKARLSETEQQLNLSAAAADVGIWTRKVGETEIIASPKWKELFGFEPSEEVTVKDFRDRVHPDDLDLVVTSATAMEVLGQDFEYEHRALLPDGQIRWISSFGKVEAVDGKPYMLRGASVDITNRRLAEQATKELAAIVESSEDAIYSRTLDGVIITWNRGAEKQYGYSAEEIIGNNVDVIIPDEFQDQIGKVIARIRNGESIDHFESVRLAKDGRRINVSLAFAPVRDHTGQIVGVSTTARDITQRVLALEAAQKSDDRNRDLLRALPDLLFIQTPDGVYVDYHVPDTKDLFVPPDNFMGMNMSEIFPPELAAEFRRAFDLAMETGEMQIVEYQLAIEGKMGWYEARIVRGRDEKILSVVRDVTSRVEAENAVRENEHLLSESQRIAHVGSWRADISGAVQWSDETFRMYGVSRETFEPTVESLLDLTHPEDRPKLQRWIEDCAAGRSPGDLEMRPVLPDGSVRIISGRGELIGEPGAEGSFMAGTVQDITDRKRAEQAIRESEERFRNMADTAPVMIWVTGIDKLCTYVNQGWLRFTDRTLEQELGSGWADALHRDDLDHCMEVYTSAFDRREIFTVEYRLRRADGVYRWILASGSPRFSYDGEFLGYIGSCVDISDQKEAAEALSELGGNLINAQEIERTRVARELHDDSSQSLALLSIQLDGLIQKINDPDLLRKEVDALKLHIQRLSLDLHRISHELHPAKLEQLGLEAAIRGFCREIEAAHDIEIAVTSDNLPGSLPNNISLSLYRVIQESLQNVVKHSGATTVDVSIDRRDDELCLTVTDNGIGFDPKTAKFKGSLGLISMNERLRSLQGSLTVESATGSGARIIARVPHIAG